MYTENKSLMVYNCVVSSVGLAGITDQLLQHTLVLAENSIIQIYMCNTLSSDYAMMTDTQLSCSRATVATYTEK